MNRFRFMLLFDLPFTSERMSERFHPLRRKMELVLFAIER